MLLILMLCLCGCNSDCDRAPNSMFTVIKENGYKLMYDNDTKVVYIYIGYGLSPYYIVKDNKAEIAIYGQNYFSK